jgi:hypothetical protein
MTSTGDWVRVCTQALCVVVCCVCWLCSIVCDSEVEKS